MNRALEEGEAEAHIRQSIRVKALYAFKMAIPGGGYLNCALEEGEPEAGGPFLILAALLLLRHPDLPLQHYQPPLPSQEK